MDVLRSPRVFARTPQARSPSEIHLIPSAPSAKACAQCAPSQENVQTVPLEVHTDTACARLRWRCRGYHERPRTSAITLYPQHSTAINACHPAVCRLLRRMRCIRGGSLRVGASRGAAHASSRAREQRPRLFSGLAMLALLHYRATPHFRRSSPGAFCPGSLAPKCTASARFPLPSRSASRTRCLPSSHAGSIARFQCTTPLWWRGIACFPAVRGVLKRTPRLRASALLAALAAV
ncbi:hypothetical protein C8R44DRAFT_194163 [Mycena epipterygia]|nr:hypothetical protein C8R44DRAFT_194163 [Mycena epipterygia]